MKNAVLFETVEGCIYCNYFNPGSRTGWNYFVFVTSVYKAAKKNRSRKYNHAEYNCTKWMDNAMRQYIKISCGKLCCTEFLQMDADDYLAVNQELKSMSPVLYNALLTNQYCKDIKIYTDKQYHISTNWVENSQKCIRKTWYQKIMSHADTVWWNEDGTLFMGKK